MVPPSHKLVYKPLLGIVISTINHRNQPQPYLNWTLSTGGPILPDWPFFLYRSGLPNALGGQTLQMPLQPYLTHPASAASTTRGIPPAETPYAFLRPQKLGHFWTSDGFHLFLRFLMFLKMVVDGFGWFLVLNTSQGGLFFCDYPISNNIRHGATSFWERLEFSRIFTSVLEGTDCSPVDFYYHPITTPFLCYISVFVVEYQFSGGWNRHCSFTNLRFFFAVSHERWIGCSVARFEGSGGFRHFKPNSGSISSIPMLHRYNIILYIYIYIQYNIYICMYV